MYNIKGSLLDSNIIINYYNFLVEFYLSRHLLFVINKVMKIIGNFSGLINIGINYIFKCIKMIIQSIQLAINENIIYLNFFLYNIC